MNIRKKLGGAMGNAATNLANAQKSVGGISNLDLQKAMTDLAELAESQSKPYKGTDLEEMTSKAIEFSYIALRDTVIASAIKSEHAGACVTIRICVNSDKSSLLEIVHLDWNLTELTHQVALEGESLVPAMIKNKLDGDEVKQIFANYDTIYITVDQIKSWIDAHLKTLSRSELDALANHYVGTTDFTGFNAQDVPRGGLINSNLQWADPIGPSIPTHTVTTSQISDVKLNEGEHTSISDFSKMLIAKAGR